MCHEQSGLAIALCICNRVYTPCCFETFTECLKKCRNSENDILHLYDVSTDTGKISLIIRINVLMCARVADHHK